MTSEDPAQQDPAALVFHALGDSTRRDILRAVCELGPVSATKLATERHISRQAIAKHLGILGDAGLVCAVRNGREVQFRADPTALQHATAWIDEAGAAWDRRLGRLTSLLGDRPT